MLVCPSDFSTRQKDRFEFFRSGEHAVLARSVRPRSGRRVPRGSSTRWGGRGAAGGRLGSTVGLAQLRADRPNPRSSRASRGAVLSRLPTMLSFTRRPSTASAATPFRVRRISFSRRMGF